MSKPTFSHIMQRALFRKRKAWFEKHMPVGSHTMEEVQFYVKDVHGFYEVESRSEEYQVQYRQMRTSFILKHGKEDSDMDLHLYKKEHQGAQMYLILETKDGYIGGSVDGSDAARKEYAKIFRDIYRYYGVTQEDIEHKTERYENLLAHLVLWS